MKGINVAIHKFERNNETVKKAVQSVDAFEYGKNGNQRVPT